MNKYSNEKHWKKAYKRKPNHKYTIKRTERIIEMINKVIPLNNLSVLDVGCGQGDFTFQLMRYSDNITGMDHSEYLLNRNPCKNKKLGSATKLVFRDNSFDIVFESHTLHHIPEYKKVIKEMIRVSKKYIILYDDNPNNIFTKYIGMTRETDKMLLKKEFSMEELTKSFENCEVKFSSYVVNLVFTNTFPCFLLKFMPKPFLTKYNVFGNNFLLILEKNNKTL